MLTSMPGAGFAIALAIIAEAVDTKRFAGAEKLAAARGFPRRAGAAAAARASTGA